MVNPGAQKSEPPLPFSPNKSAGCGSEEDEGKMSRVSASVKFFCWRSLLSLRSKKNDVFDF